MRLNHQCELYQLIPRDKLNHLFEHSTAGAELDYTFLCFEEIYKSVTTFVPKSFTIIDLGCAYATQSWYFRDYKRYIGVDISGNDDSVIHTVNSTYYFMSIQEFVENLSSLELDLNMVYAICSYVPDEQARELVRNTFKNCLVYYPKTERMELE